MAQYDDEFEKLHKEHLLILTRLGAIQTTVSLILRGQSLNVTPELEAEILKSSALSASIDEKVPDQE